MKTLCNVGLYLSSFIPMYILIIIKEVAEIINGNLTFDFTNSLTIILNLIFIIYGLVCVIIVYNLNNYFSVNIKSINNVTRENFLPYFPIFVLFALTFELEYISMVIVYLLIIIAIGVVYIKNEMYYINPFLNIMGFSIYEVCATDFNDKKIVKKIFISNCNNSNLICNNMFCKKKK